MAKLAVGDAEQSTGVARPRIVTALGKQRSGKSTFLRYYVERGAKDRTRLLKLLDADPHNDTLKQHYPEAMSPDSSGLEDRRISLEQSIRDLVQAATTGNTYDMLLDVGGGDLLLPRMARDIQISELVEQLGVELIVFYMLSPSLSDLEYFQTLDDAGFQPKRLCLILNGGLIQGDRKPHKAFEAMTSAPLVETLVGRGAQIRFMPALASDCVEAVERTKSPTLWGALPKLNDMMYAMRLRTWLDKQMEVEVAKPLTELGWLI